VSDNSEPVANTSAEVVLKWGDSKYLFALKGRQIEHLERSCGSGIQEIGDRLMRGAARFLDIRRIIELGLEGGGMPPVQVADSMGRWFDGQPLANPNDPANPLATAQAIFLAAWLGIGDLSSGEAPAGAGPAKRKRTSRATGQRSSISGRTRPTSKRTRSTK
jgi:hypothetical protein